MSRHTRLGVDEDRIDGRVRVQIENGLDRQRRQQLTRSLGIELIFGHTEWAPEVVAVRRENEARLTL